MKAANERDDDDDDDDDVDDDNDNTVECSGGGGNEGTKERMNFETLALSLEPTNEHTLAGCFIHTEIDRYCCFDGVVRCSETEVPRRRRRRRPRQRRCVYETALQSVCIMAKASQLTPPNLC